MTQHRSSHRINWGRIIGLLVAGVVLVALAGTAFTLLTGGPEDFTGSGKGEVVVTIPPGADGQKIANVLHDANVTKSAEAFYQLAIDDERAATIAAGTYRLKKEMSAKSALDALLDKKNRVESQVTVIEGARIDQIIAAIDQNTDIAKSDVTKILDNPGPLGLPPSAEGNPEGYLFPATYPVEPGTSALELLKTMVGKTLQVAESLDIEARAKALGLTYEEALTVASLIEAEAKNDEDLPKVARVIYNRLDQDMALQLDSTSKYVSGSGGDGDQWTSDAERANPSAYNTYANTGLPPGPIGAPGERAIEAALNPADGDWLFYFNRESGELVFTSSNEEHVKELCKEYPGHDLC